MKKRTLLFVCTGNCCRSQMAEAIGRYVAGEKFEVHSCGAEPAGYVHPLALGALAAMNIPADGLESKSWNEFLDRDIDIAISVCENAAAICPVFPGGGVKAAWPMPDPSFLGGTEAEREEFARRIAERLKLKLERLASLDLDALDIAALREQLNMLADL